jgi:hypothetical protein
VNFLRIILLLALVLLKKGFYTKREVEKSTSGALQYDFLASETMQF